MFITTKNMQLIIIIPLLDANHSKPAQSCFIFDRIVTVEFESIPSYAGLEN